MNRFCLAVVGLHLWSLVAVAAEKPARPAKADPVTVTIELCDVEINVRKLQEMGIDWEKASRHASVAAKPAWLRKWTDLLLENNLVLHRSNPKLATIVDREAVFDVGDLRETVKPRMKDDKIEVAVTLESFDMVPLKDGAWTRGEQRATYSTVATFKPGETKLLRHIPSTTKDTDGDETETATLTFLTVDLIRPETEQAERVMKPTDSERRAGPVIVGARPLGSSVKIDEQRASEAKAPGFIEIPAAPLPRRR